ncbi:MAG: hypothetical protein HZC54_12480 [Verrucomicrobia bacterium]|nr:hypothetical protein [Verrucomicrobiota bacterium]
MKRALSILVFLLCSGAAGAAVGFVIALLPQITYAITTESEGWGVFFYETIAPFLAGGTLLLGVIPSAFLYRNGRHRLDAISLGLSGLLLAVIVITWLVAEPLRHWINFGGR